MADKTFETLKPQTFESEREYEAKQLAAATVAAVLDPLIDGATLNLSSGAYSIAAVSGDAILTRADDSTVTLIEGIVLEAVSTDVIKAVTASNPGKVQIIKH